MIWSPEPRSLNVKEHSQYHFIGGYLWLHFHWWGWNGVFPCMLPGFPVGLKEWGNISLATTICHRNGLHSVWYHYKCSSDIDIQCCLCVYVVDMRPSENTPCDIQDPITLHAHASAHIQFYWRGKDNVKSVLVHSILDSCCVPRSVTMWPSSSFGMFVIHCLSVQSIWSQLIHIQHLKQHTSTFEFHPSGIHLQASLYCNPC
jgi:hypothetical protein